MTDALPIRRRPEPRRVTTPVGTETKTKQSMAAACDVNAIMRRHLSTGSVEHLTAATAVYGDFSNVDDYHTAMNRIRRCEEHFDGLPAAVRDRCGNDPAVLVEMFSTGKVEELREMGLLPPETPQDPTPQPPAEPDEAEPGTGDPA